MPDLHIWEKFYYKKIRNFQLQTLLLSPLSNVIIFQYEISYQSGIP
jgi:hypothetical protein